MIQTEKHEKQQGYERRIDMLYAFRNMAEVHKDCEHFYANYNSAKEEIVSCGISSNDELLDSVIRRFLRNFLR